MELSLQPPLSPLMKAVVAGSNPHGQGKYAAPSQYRIGDALALKTKPYYRRQGKISRCKLPLFGGMVN
jgi:hypothetical protein